MTDIPPRIRLLFAAAAAGGLIFIVMGTLAGDGIHHIELDKLIHGCGYGLLGLLIVLALPPVWYLPALLVVVLTGLGLEFIQAKVIPARSFEWDDVVANTVGTFAGCCLGFVARVIWIYVRTEMVSIAEKRRHRTFHDGQIIFRQGEPSDHVYVIRHGKVRVLRESSGKTTELAVAIPGEVLGEMGVIEHQPRSATAVAVGRADLYAMDAHLLHEKVEGREHPAVPIARVLAKRLREADRRLEGG